MKNRSWAAAFALGALLCLSAGEAFAGLQRVSQDDAPESWFINFSAQLQGSGLNSPFNNMRVMIGAPVTYTINSQTYTISNPSLLEDISGSGGHKAIQDFSIINPPASSTWAQTAINATPGGTNALAAGNSFSTSGQILNFNIYFQGAQTDGTHFFLEFYNGTTFVTGYEIKDLLAVGTAHPDGFEQTNYSTSQLVPLPSAALMGGLALLAGMGAFAARRRRSLRVLS